MPLRFLVYEVYYNLDSFPMRVEPGSRTCNCFLSCSFYPHLVVQIFQSFQPYNQFLPQCFLFAVVTSRVVKAQTSISSFC